MKDMKGQRIILYRCENCGHPVFSVRAAENIEQNGCPVCTCKRLESISMSEEEQMAIPAYEIVQLQAHLARREARQ